ncbi:hypothetical protein G6F69_000942 [Rhizopus microsporus]|nr:hypothetical protein G6F69_000942 [Rhizopus microsporus]
MLKHLINESEETLTMNTYFVKENDENKRLDCILSCPQQLACFQAYLQEIHAHENLLFIEALSELRHEKDMNNIEVIVLRIWKTFFSSDSQLELNVYNKNRVNAYFQAHKWAIVTKEEALSVFRNAELEAKQFLNEKVIEFDKIYGPHMPVNQLYSRYKKRVVVIGGGFTGFTIASILDPMPRFHVTLVDTKDSFEYTPGMIKLLVRPEQTSSLRVRHDAYVKNGRVVIGYAEKIINDGKAVQVNNEIIPFDYLAICTGSRYKSKLKSFDISSLYRLSELANEHNDLKRAKSVLIIGGGLVGCELASEIATHQYLPPYDFKKKITIVDSYPCLVRRSSAKRQQNALNYFQSLGVEVVLNEKIVDFDSANTNSYLGSRGTIYKGYDKVFLATGTSPCSELLQDGGDIGFESCVDHWGRARVKPTLQLDHWKYDHIFAGGNITNVVEEKTGYAATLAGVCIARNICRMEKGKPPLNQGSKGTLPAPKKPLHGVESNGGMGRRQLSAFKKTFSFLNPTWAALKYFDEKEFLEIVQGEARVVKTAVGKKPKILGLSGKPELFKSKEQQKQQPVPLTSFESPISRILFHKTSTTNLSGSDVISNSNFSMNDTESEFNSTCVSDNESDHTYDDDNYKGKTIQRFLKHDSLQPRPHSLFPEHSI